MAKQQEKITTARDACKKLLEVGELSYQSNPSVAVELWKV
jgi:hypothetical protein